MATAVKNPTSRHEMVKGIALKSLSTQVSTDDTTLHLQIRELTPIGGDLEVTNVGENLFTGVVNVHYLGEGKHERNLVTSDILKLQPGESKTFSMGIMMPGCIVFRLGMDFENLVEVIRLPSPGGQC
mgnify:CR=1 FL=1